VVRPLPPLGHIDMKDCCGAGGRLRAYRNEPHRRKRRGNRRRHTPAPPLHCSPADQHHIRSNRRPKLPATAARGRRRSPPTAGGARLPPILDALHGGAGSRSERGSHGISGRRRLRRSIESVTSRSLMSKQIFRRPRPNAWPDAAGMIQGNSTCGCRGDWRAYRHAWIRTRQLAVSAGAVAAGAPADRLVRVTVKKERRGALGDRRCDRNMLGGEDKVFCDRFVIRPREDSGVTQRPPFK
jgi:hypothetical protein